MIREVCDMSSFYQMFQTFESLVDILVVVAGLFGWLIFLPQIKLLLEVKKSESISLGLVWGSFAMQAVMFLQGILKKNWPLVLVMSTSLICLVIMLWLIYRYRRWPGGK